MNLRIAGVDEAGRGPAIGPLVIAGVVLPEEKIGQLSAAGVKDSKKLTAKKREALLKPIKEIIEGQHVEIIDAEFIDGTRAVRNLNRIEADFMAKILDALHPDVAQVGSADVVPSRFKSMIRSGMKTSSTEIISVHHAEDQFPAVAAASIIAKTTRDSIVNELHKEFGDFGSGYPHDPKTKAFLREVMAKDEAPRIVRLSWRTVLNIAEERLFEDDEKE